MKTMWAYIVTLAMILAVLPFVGRAQSTRETAEFKIATVAGCQCSLNTPRSSYRSDQPILIRLVIKNQSDKPVNLLEAGMLDYRIVVTGPDGQVCPLTREGRRQLETRGISQIFYKVDAGKADETDIAMLNRIFDMTLAGQYTVTAHRQIWVSGDAKPVELTSNTIKITITERGQVPDSRPSNENATATAPHE